MENNSKKVKNIQLRLKLKGFGIVNFDGDEQRHLHLFPSRLWYSNKNISYGKRNFYENADGVVTSKNKISEACLRHSIFAKDIPFQCQNVVHENALLYSMLGCEAYILRGNLFAKQETFKRKGAFGIIDAEQIPNEDSQTALSSIETFCKSGEKNSDSEVTDNSFFKKETLGHINYQTIGFIDLEQLQFVSTDIVSDRLAFNPDNFKLFSDFLKTRMPDFKSKLGWYQMKGSVNLMPEYGFVFNNEDAIHLVKYMLERVLLLNIKRKSAYVNVSELEYKLVYDPLEDTQYNEDGWVSVKTMDDVKNINFEMENFYIEYNEEEAKKLKQTIEDNYKKANKESSDKKQKQKQDRADSKAKKKSESKEPTNS